MIRCHKSCLRSFREGYILSFLYFLEGIRTPVTDVFFSIITHIGEETIFIIIGLLFFWCIDKREGYFILSVGFMGTVINQFLKIVCRIPRPWVKDPNFTIVESARAEATGYSFPSGHTQSAVGSFGSIARWTEKRSVRAVCIVLCILIPLSRLYLGVHSPADVAVAAASALVLIFLLYPIIKKAIENPRLMWILIAVMGAASLSFLLFTELYGFPADIDTDNYNSAIKNAYTLTGCLAGLAVTFFVDNKYTHFETEAALPAQLLKLAGGSTFVLAVKSGLKAPLLSLFGGHPVSDLVRYFIVVVLAGAVWPITFKYFSRMGKKKDE